MNRTGFALPFFLLAISKLALGAELAPTDLSSPTHVVRFNDLNLTRPEGIRVLYARLRTASAAVCGERSRTNSAIVSPAWQKCTNEALQLAVNRLDRPALTAYHLVRTGAVPATVRAAAVPSATNGR